MELTHMLSWEYCQPEAGFLLSGSSRSHWQLIFAVSGELHAVVDGFDTALTPGQLLLCPPDVFSMHYAREGQAPEYLAIAFEARELNLLPLAGKALAQQELLPMLQIMAREARRQDASAPLLENLLAATALLLSRSAAAQPEALPRRPQQGENTIIRRAQQYISAHIRDKLSVTLVAQGIDVSPSYMTALFQKHLSISPGEYIRRAKLHECKQLIQQGQLNFTQIAAALEYSTVHHFSRQFKEHFGITPTEYAKSIGTKGA